MASAANSSDGLPTTMSFAVTPPATMAACALARLSNKPRSTSRRSMRMRGAIVQAYNAFRRWRNLSGGNRPGRGSLVAGPQRCAGDIPHAIAAVALGLVQRLVSALHQGPDVVSFRVRFGHSDADGHPHMGAV